MASNTSTGHTAGPKRSSVGGFTASNGAIGLEKSRLNARRSTPDSEVMASSDDEVDKHIAEPSAVLPPKPTRRSSWLSEVQTLPQRRGSLASAGPRSPNNSNPSTPTGDSSSWGPTPGAAVPRAHAAANSFTWGSGIWNNDSRKEPPARLTEVLPSPTSMAPPVSSPLYNENEPLTSPNRDQAGDSTIPFAIPLHPTPKTYRSQSYSVGQLDPDPNNGLVNNLPASYMTGRTRPNQPSGLQHRPSRPSMLSELSHEGTSLDRVREVEDDDESTNSSQQGVQLSSSDANIVEQLARENAMLRQAAATNQLENMRLRSRAATTNTVSGPYTAGQPIPSGGHVIQESVPEEADYAIDELDELHGINGKGATGRRYSEYSAPLDSRFSSFTVPENRKLESLKKGHWQSSLGFGGVVEGQQSRRHSFADIPARSGSISSVGDNAYASEGNGTGLGRGLGARNDAPARYMDSAARPMQGENPSYFSGIEPAQRSGPLYAATSQPPSLHQAYLMQGSFGAGRAQSPLTGIPRTLSANSQHNNLSQARQGQLLCVITFKCCRSEVFYVQEGTGLEVNIGDMVIVEADRGTDLGTVAQVNVSWSQAKYWKEKYAEEHYKWLMLFSRHSGQAENGNGLPHGGLLSTHGALGSAVGGMGPQGGQRGTMEPNTGELKPKMIKRLAQNHEIQSLRDKEGNEAKAKRVCQQKVVEHRLQMEVLDAEFQVDWKKLTFYYFADAYINFNSLVTDLFKIYKTRIWMSAINPASFATPSAGLQPPSGIGPGALGVGADGLAENRPQQDNPAYGPLGIPRSYQTSFARSPELGQDNSTGHIGTLPTAFAYGFQPYGQGQRQSPTSLAEYGQGFSQGNDVTPDFRPVDFGGFRQDQARGTSHFEMGGDRRPQINNDGLMGSFQGLSLGPR